MFRIWILQQGAARIEEEEAICRRSNGEDCDMTLKNNIEAIIIKWAYQIDEVLSRDSDEELNVPGINFLLTLLRLDSFGICI